MNPEIKFETLKQALADWQDFDAAGYRLACCLGIFPNGAPGPKHLYWGANPLGESLGRFLDELVSLGVLEFDDAGTNLRYRWNPAFKTPS